MKKVLRITITTIRNKTRWKRVPQCTHRHRLTKIPLRVTATCTRWVIQEFRAQIRQQKERGRTMILCKEATRYQRTTKRGQTMRRYETRSKASNLMTISTMFLHCLMEDQASFLFPPTISNSMTRYLQRQLTITCLTSRRCPEERKRQQKVLF